MRFSSVSGAVSAGATLAGGGSVTTMENQNSVVIRPRSTNEGLQFNKVYILAGAASDIGKVIALTSPAKAPRSLPRYVIVQEVPGGGVEVAAINPVDSMGSVGSTALAEVAATVRDKLQRAISTVQ